MLCHLFLGYNRLGIFLRHRPFALRSRSLSLARQLKGLHGGVRLFWKNPPMPLYWLARKWWAKTAPCQLLCNIRAPLRQAQGATVFLLRQSSFAEHSRSDVSLPTRPFDRLRGRRMSLLLCLGRSMSLSKGTSQKKMILGKNGVLRG